MKNKCVVTACKRDSVYPVHGLCNAHYQRFRRTGDPGTSKIRNPRVLENYRDVLARKAAEASLNG